MKRISIIIINISLILVSILTMVNLYYSFPSFKYTVLSKLLLVGFVLLLFILLFNFLLKKFFTKKWQILITIILLVVYSFGLFKANEFLLSYSNLFKTIQIETTKSNLIAPIDSPINDIDDISDSTTIGLQSVKNFQHGNLPLEEIKKLEKTDSIKQYTSFEDSYKALVAGDIDLMSGPELDDKQLLELNEEFDKEYKIIATFEADSAYEKVEKDITSTPFTILVSGIDSRSSNVKDVSNSDSNILVTFNPTTGKITTLTTPRDSYIQLQCGSFVNDKLTHAAAYGGTKCVKDTLEKFYDVKIDYSLTINFVGVIDVVDALGGIDVDIPENQMNVGNAQVCEQNSRGVKDKLCWEEGKVNHLDGETALAFARNRYNQDGGDFSRGRNQQIVIEAVLKKATSINNMDTINKLLAAASKHMSSNMTKDEIISLYEILIGLDNDIIIEKLYINGATGMVNNLSVVYPSIDATNYASYRMKVNLGLVEPQFPSNGYFIEGSKPSYDNGNNPLRAQQMPFDLNSIIEIKEAE